MADLSLTPNDPRPPARQKILVGIMNENNVFLQVGNVVMDILGGFTSLQQADCRGAACPWATPVESEFSLRQRRWMLFYEI